MGSSQEHLHDHGHLHAMRGASKRNLWGALLLILTYMIAEVIGGLLSGSLALLADAGHKLMDVASIGFALVAVHVAAKSESAQRTFGYHRLEILVALANALALWLIAFEIVTEAYARFTGIDSHGHAGHEHAQGGPMLVIGSVGILVNVSAAWILRQSARTSVNVEAAFAHIVADTVGAIGLVVSGVIILAFGWTIVDPILGGIIGCMILLSTFRLLGKVIRTLLQGTPEHIDVFRLCSDMGEIPGVVFIHDIHVWNLVPGYDVLTAHIIVDPAYGIDEVRDLRRKLRKIATEDFGIKHVTLQLEDSASDCTEHHHVDHLHRRSAEIKIRRGIYERLIGGHHDHPH